MKKILIIFIFILSLSYVFPEATDDNVKVLLKKDYIETLKYGIEKEILSLLKDLGKNPSQDFYTILIERYKDASISNTKIGLINYFADCENLPQEVVDMLYKDAKEDPTHNKVHSTLLNFLGKKGKYREGLLLIERLDHYENIIKSSASDSLSGISDKELLQPLLDRLKEADEDDDKYLSNDIKSRIILSFGEMQAVEAVPYLRDIIGDPANDKFMIMYGMHSIAKIGDLESIDIIAKNLENDEIKIQEYAGYALSLFKSDKVVPILEKMLRHNNEKVRLNACKGLVLNYSISSVNILEYKANKDPSSKVRNEAISSLLYLGKAGTNVINRLLKKKSNYDSLLYILSDSTRKNPDDSSVDFIMALYDSATDKQKEIIAKNIVRGTSNKLDPMVLKLTKSNDHLIRFGALKAIYNIKDTTLIYKLKELSQNDPSPLVKKTALKYLSLKQN